MESGGCACVPVQATKIRHEIQDLGGSLLQKRSGAVVSVLGS